LKLWPFWLFCFFLILFIKELTSPTSINNDTDGRLSLRGKIRTRHILFIYINLFI
jgi:hypothetical protein